MDDNGIMRWTGTGDEVALFGVNYSTPFAHAYRAHGYLGVDRKRAIDSDSESVICYADEIEFIEPEPETTEQDIQQAFELILQGNFYQIPDQHLPAVVERLSPFMQYVDNQNEQTAGVG